MRIVKPGTGAKEWSKTFTCTGKGNGNGGCNAELEIGKSDLFKTFVHARDETDTYVTFECPCCHVLTDIESRDYPHNWHALPDQKAYQKNKAKAQVDAKSMLIEALKGYQASNRRRTIQESFLYQQAEEALSCADA